MDATRPWRLEGVVRRYAWGSRSAIPELLGEAPDGEPQAELWLGAHPSAPARLRTDEGPLPLDAWIRRDPDAVLGAHVAECFGAELPFLLKVLAADAPLSIQAHPNREQARAGFARENEAGIPLDAPSRNYRDANAKPELVCAMTPFRALNRFRTPEEIEAGIAALGVRGLEALLAPLRAAPDRADLARFFATWMDLPAGERARLVGEAATAAAETDPSQRELRRLAEAYPGDAGVLAPLFLNLVELAPGEAMFLPAGELHAYLGGVALEVMASSDNVLRGGLTAKHVDVPELLRTLTFRSGPVEVLTPREGAAGEVLYEAPAEEFALARIEVRPGVGFEAAPGRGIEILLCTEGAGRLECGTTLPFERGHSVAVPAAAPAYRIEGQAVLYRASVAAA